MGRCVPPQEPCPPAFALPLLKKCVLAGDGTTSLIRLIAIPATALVFLAEPYTNNWAAFPWFDTRTVAPGLHILGEISAVSFSITDHTARLQARNDRGGVLDVEVDELYDLSGDPYTFTCIMRSFFSCWRTCPGLETTKEFTLCMERDGVWNRRVTMPVAWDLVQLLSHLPGIEDAKLHGIPSLELSSILLILTHFSRVPTWEAIFPNLKRLDIESSPLRCPTLLLAELDRLLVVRDEAGMSLQSVTVKVRCEVLIPAMDHCTLLTSWEGLVEGRVSLEYERIEVRKLLTRRYCLYREDDADDKGQGEGDGDCVGWDGWPDKWPTTVEEMRAEARSVPDGSKETRVLC